MPEVENTEKNNYIDNEKFDKVISAFIEALEKDVNNAFPLIIDKSLRCLEVSKVLMTEDESVLSAANNDLESIKGIITQEIIDATNQVIEKYK